MERFYRLVGRRYGETYDPARAAWLEVEWWRVHREHQYEDPDGEDVRVDIGVTVKCSADKAFAAYEQFVSRWVETVPWSASRLIRLSYNTVK